MNAVAGVATFSGLTLNKLGGNYTIQLTDGALTSVTTNTITVVPGTASQLVISTQPPTSLAVNVPFGLTVTAFDDEGNLATSFNGTLAVALANNPGGSTLAGVLTATAVHGTATFAGLSLNNVGAGYTIQVSGAGVTSVTSSPFTITPEQPTQLVVATQPPTSVSAGTGFGFTVNLENSSGNILTGNTDNLTATLLANPGGSTLGGNISVSAVAGVATFSGLTLNKPGAGYVIQISGDNLTTTTTTFTVVAGAPAQLIIISQPPSSVALNSPFGFTVVAYDTSGNPATSFNGNVAVALANNPAAATLGGTLTVTAVNGVAKFSGLFLNQVAYGYTLQITSAGLRL